MSHSIIDSLWVDFATTPTNTVFES